MGYERRYNLSNAAAGPATAAGPACTLERNSDEPRIVGYAALFYREDDPATEYRLLPDLVERIHPDAFTRAIREDDTRALIDHDSRLVLGRRLAGTLTLSIDRRGLYYEIDPPKTQPAADLIESIRRGDISGASFGFRPRVTNWTRNAAGDDIRELRDVELIDISPVAYPAYQAATSGLRHELERTRHRHNKARRHLKELARCSR